MTFAVSGTLTEPRLKNVRIIAELKKVLVALRSAKKQSICQVRRSCLRKNNYLHHILQQGVKGVIVLLIALMALDPVGNVSLSIQIAILFLLVLGIPLARGPTSRKNLIRHGYSTIVAVALHTVLIFAVMIPVLVSGSSEFGSLSLLSSITVWSHAVFGTTAEVSGIVLVVAWVRRGTSKMTCASWKKWMMPTLIIWVLAVVNGALVHILGLL